MFFFGKVANMYQVGMSRKDKKPYDDHHCKRLLLH
jgi:hypothetical protein